MGLQIFANSLYYWTRRRFPRCCQLCDEGRVCIDLHVSLRWYRVLDNPNPFGQYNPPREEELLFLGFRVIPNCFQDPPAFAGDPENKQGSPEPKK